MPSESRPPNHAYAYAVLARGTDPALRDRYLAWLTTGGHVRAVIQAGARSGEVMVLDEPATDGPGWAIETRYHFASKDAFEAYVCDHAPALRAEGQRLFPPESGIRLERRAGWVYRT